MTEESALRRTPLHERHTALGTRFIGFGGREMPRDEEPVGVVTSGSQSPTLGEAIAMACMPPSDASAGTMLQVAVRDAAVDAEVVPLPFHRRRR